VKYSRGSSSGSRMQGAGWVCTTDACAVCVRMHVTCACVLQLFLLCGAKHGLRGCTPVTVMPALSQWLAQQRRIALGELCR
jgi:hypothetical protein